MPIAAAPTPAPSAPLIERPRCPVCDAAGATLYRAPFDREPLLGYLQRLYPGFDEHGARLLAGGEYVLERCGACGLIWQRFAPAGELLRALYESWPAATGGLARHDDVAYHRAAAEEILLVLELAGRPPSDVAVLDFGMGWGRWPRLAAAFGCRAAGVEIAGPQRDYARSQGVEVLELDELPDATFAFVNSEQVFEHLVAPAEALTRLGRALAPDGWLKLGVPPAGHVERLLNDPDWAAPRGSRRSLLAVAPLEHLNCYPPSALAALGAQAGLRVVRPPAAAAYASTIGLWPPRRLARGLARPPLRRLVRGATFFRPG